MKMRGALLTGSWNSLAQSAKRDLRGEALRCERQKLLDVNEELVREQKALQRELSKQSQALSVTMDEQVRRTKEVDSALGNIAERRDAAELAAEVLKRETGVSWMPSHHLLCQNESNVMHSLIDL
jgi:hypothetical protein